MTRIEDWHLDNILRHLGEPLVHGIQMHPVTDAEVRALIAELRAARDVVEETRKPTGPGWLWRVITALEAYDRVVADGEVTP